MGTRLKHNQEDGGSFIEGDVPLIKGASLKVTICEGDVNFSKVKVGSERLFLQFPFFK